MDTIHVEAVIAVVEHGSFAKAAATLHITAAGVASRVRALERHLGTEVVERNGERWVLNAKGRHLEPHFHALLELVSEIKGAA